MTRPDSAEPGSVTIRIAPSFDWTAMLRFFAVRAIPGVEAVVDGRYCRTIRRGKETGVLGVSRSDGGLRAELWLPSGTIPEEVVPRLRDMFDLDADLPAIGRYLSRDSAMAELVALRPQVRIPGGWDPFEVALRAVLGQQVSVVAARALAARLVARCGEDVVEQPFPALSRTFPTPGAVVAADLSNMGMPGARVRTLQSVAAAFTEDPALFHKRASVEETVARLRQIKGVGEWTAQYIALRACREPDAFPAADVGILRGLADTGGRPTLAAVLERAEKWRPYRAYAAHHIWAHDEARSAAN